MATSDTLIDTLFDGRYRVLRRLGRGGMADVYLAEDEELGRRVAIKVLNERHAADAQFVERFRREATNAAGLSHPNIVSIYDRGEAEGTYYIAMEYLDGSTLKDVVVEQGPLPVEDAISYVRDLLGALRFAHRKGIVHRDIKPHNVMADSDGRIKVTDFGIARAGASQMTEAGSIIGTAQYLSPEQARGGVIDHRSDLYSVGIVLFELLTGTVPFGGETPVEIAMKHLSSVPDPPSQRRPDLPRALDQIVLRALAKDPEERYQTAEEMDAELARVADGLPVSAQTAEAATQVLAGAGIAEAATVVARPARAPRPAAPVPPYRPPAHGYYYDEPAPHGRPIWPWLIALLLLLAAAGAVWLAWGKIQDQLNETKTVAVPDVRGIREILAVRQLRAKGFEPAVRRQTDADVAEGFVISQDPPPGDQAPRGKVVQVVSSLGAPLATVPDVRGKTRDRGDPAARRPWAETDGVRRALPETGGHRGRARPRARQDRPGQVEGADQCLEGSRAGERAARRRAAVRGGRRAAPGGRLRRGPAGRRLERAGGRRRRPEPGVELRHGQGRHDHALRLEGADGSRGARGDRLRRGVGAGRAGGRGLRRPGARPGDDGRGGGRDRGRAAAGCGNTGQARLDDHDLHRPLRRDGGTRHHHAVSRLRVAILTGGRSSEHDVALASARSVESALDAERYETVTIAIGRDGRWALGPGSAGELADPAADGAARGDTGVSAAPRPNGASNSLLQADGPAAGTLPMAVRGASPALLGEVDVVFPVLHGPFGEDGSVQGLLELADVPYVGAGVTASGLCMDKDLMKAVLRDRGIPVTRNVTLRPGEPVEHPYSYPVFVKPARLGSSVGISKARTPEELAAGVELAFRHDEKVLVEEFVDGIEVECGVLGNDRPVASIPGEIVAHADWYDYAAKYDDGGMELIVPPRIPEQTSERVRELSVAAFVATGCEGMARIDCFVRRDGEVLINELNTIPGFTATSVYAKLFEASGVSYPELLDRLIELALERHRRRAGFLY